MGRGNVHTHMAVLIALIWCENFSMTIDSKIPNECPVEYQSTNPP